MLLFVVSFFAFISFLLFGNQLTTITQASNAEASPTESLIFAWPLEVPANGTSTSEITVFVRTEEGKGVTDAQVELIPTMGEVFGSPGFTDKNGEVSFQISSTTQGVAEIEVIVDNIPIQRTVSVKFTQ